MRLPFFFIVNRMFRWLGRFPVQFGPMFIGLAMASAALASAALAAPPGPTEIASVTARTTGTQTELVVEFRSAFTKPTLFALDSPRRIVIDFDNARIAGKPASAASGLISGTRLGSPGPRVTRLVIDLAEAADLVDTRTYAPAAAGSADASHRFVIQLQPASDAAFAKLRARGKIILPGTQLNISLPDDPKPALPAPQTPIGGTPAPTAAPDQPAPPADLAPAQPAPAQPAPAQPAPGSAPAVLSAPQPIATPLPRLPVANQIRGRLPLIVIDPGHGGHDPGAPSALKGRHEKDMALSVGLALKAELEKTGRFKVLMTRSADVFVPFRERTGLAQRAKADLFISIHGDSIVDPSVRGGTIYTLSDGRADKEAERLASAENKADFIGGGINMGGERDEVVDILFSLVQRETRNYAAEFAEFVARDMSRVVMMRPVYRRAASLIVLTSPDVPSVLIETGYMTSKPDSEFLFSADGQERLARSMRQAVERYFDRRLASK